jgi:hypothetical protein
MGEGDRIRSRAGDLAGDGIAAALFGMDARFESDLIAVDL